MYTVPFQLYSDLLTVQSDLVNVHSDLVFVDRDLVPVKSDPTVVHSDFMAVFKVSLQSRPNKTSRYDLSFLYDFDRKTKKNAGE